jgi:hypothetical protein
VTAGSALRIGEIVPTLPGTQGGHGNPGHASDNADIVKGLIAAEGNIWQWNHEIISQNVKLYS